MATGENWQKVREIFDSALRRKSEEHQNYIIEVCGEYKTLLLEVKSLLSSLDSAESFIETPVFGKVAEVIEGKIKTLEKSRCFGHYKIIEQLGAGGMAEVFLAEDSRLEHRIALKLMPEKFSTDSEPLNRSKQEAKAASTLNHPNIISIPLILLIATGFVSSHRMALPVSVIKSFRLLLTSRLCLCRSSRFHSYTVAKLRE